MANESIYAAFERMWSHVKALVKDVKKYVDDSVANAGGGSNISFADEAPSNGDGEDGELRMVYAANLPNGYTRITSIKGTGSQYINTGFTPDSNSRIVMDVQWAGTGGGSFFGSRNTNSATATGNNTLFITADGLPRCDYYGTSVTGSIIPTSRIIVDRNKNVTTIGDATVTNTAASGSSSYPLFLYAMNNIGAAGTMAQFTLYSCRIYDNGTLVRNFVPCTNASGVAGLYDTVNGKFYASATSTAFVAGTAVDLAVGEGYFKAEGMWRRIASAGSAKIVTGTYVGTGKAGESYPNSLTFSDVPKFLIVYCGKGGAGAFVFMHPTSSIYTAEETYGIRAPTTSVAALGQAYFYTKVSGTTISWYRASAGTNYYFQMNSADTVYHYIAFLE